MFRIKYLECNNDKSEHFGTRMPSRSSQTPIPVRITRSRRRTLENILRSLEEDVDELLRLLELAQDHVSSLKRQVESIHQDIKSNEENQFI